MLAHTACSLEHITPSSYTPPGTKVELRYLTFANLQELAGTNPKHQALSCDLSSLLDLVEAEHSDLIPGVYEGGFKVWECAFDLVNYLASTQMDVSGKKVLELGCGAALPGLFAMKSGAECVHFQDYNPEVLRFLTIPNVLLNSIYPAAPKSQTEKEGGFVLGQDGVAVTKSSTLSTHYRFFSGPWSEITSHLNYSSCSPYDLILSSETIYSLDSQSALLSALKNLVCPVKGRVLLAAKQYYFGVGGSVQSFQDLVEKDGYFTLNTCLTIGSGLPRIILELVPKT